MKALSIRQPWAWLILHASKDIENRKWLTRYRGPIAIHASKTLDKAAYASLRREFPECGIPPAMHLDYGMVVGLAHIVDCVTTHTSVWFEGPYGFVLDYVVALPERKRFPCRGQLGLFEIPELASDYAKAEPGGEVTT